jgi:hypothetical protein
MAKHTPGPWVWTDGYKLVDISTYESPGYYNNPELRGPNGTLIVGCDEYWIIGPIEQNDEMVANARLIAAAPDLLEALKAIHAMWENAFPLDFQKDTTTGIGPVWAQVRAALAKVEGGK